MKNKETVKYPHLKIKS